MRLRDDREEAAQQEQQVHPLQDQEMRLRDDGRRRLNRSKQVHPLQGSGKGTQRRPGGGGSTGATGASSSGSGNGSQRRPGVPANKNVKGQTAQRGPENRQNEKAEGKRAGTSKKDSIYKAENTYERGGGRGAFDKTDKSRSFKI